MSEMIDRVALAIDGAMFDSSQMECGERQKFVARAAIEAMRKPTIAMLDQDAVSRMENRPDEGVVPVNYVVVAMDIWPKMIDAALK